MPKRFCIICGKEKDGLEVRNDYVLDAIRWFKQNVTKDVHGNTLVVCKDDYLKYKKQREKFEHRRLIYVGLGVAFAVVALIASPRLQTLVVSLILILFLYALSLLSYMPALVVKKG